MNTLEPQVSADEISVAVEALDIKRAETIYRNMAVWLYAGC